MFWLNLALALFFGAYAMAFFSGAAQADWFMAGVMAAYICIDCVRDSIGSKRERKGV